MAKTRAQSAAANGGVQKAAENRGAGIKKMTETERKEAKRKSEPKRQSKMQRLEAFRVRILGKPSEYHTIEDDNVENVVEDILKSINLGEHAEYVCAELKDWLDKLGEKYHV